MLSVFIEAALIVGLGVFLNRRRRGLGQLWNEPRVPWRYLWCKTMVVALLVATAFFVGLNVFVDPQVPGSSGLAFGGVLALVQGYILALLVVVFLTKLRCQHRKLLAFVGFGGGFTGGLPYFATLAIIARISLFGLPLTPAFGNIVVLICFGVQAALAFALMFSHEWSRRPVETQIPGWLWALYLIPTNALILFSGLRVLGGVDNPAFWFLAWALLLAIGPVTAAFVIIGRRTDRFHTLTHELTATAVSLLNGIGPIALVIALVAHNNAWLLLGFVVQSLGALALILVRWDKKDKQFTLRGTSARRIESR